jgi:hypothetical protein
MKPMKLKPRTASAKSNTANRYPDKREIWTQSHERFNQMMDELHIGSLQDEEMQKVARESLNKLSLRRRVE